MHSNEQLRAAAYLTWLNAEIQVGIDDSRPNLPHDEVMTEMDADLPDIVRDRLANPQKGIKVSLDEL